VRYCGNYGSNFSAVSIEIRKISARLWSNWADFGNGTKCLRGIEGICGLLAKDFHRSVEDGGANRLGARKPGDRY